MDESDWTLKEPVPISGYHYMSSAGECCGYTEMMGSGKRCEKCPAKPAKATISWKAAEWKPLEWAKAPLSSDVFVKAMKDIEEADRKMRERDREEYRRSLDRRPGYDRFS